MGATEQRIINRERGVLRITIANILDRIGRKAKRASYGKADVAMVLELERILEALLNIDETIEDKRP